MRTLNIITIATLLFAIGCESTMVGPEYDDYDNSDTTYTEYLETDTIETDTIDFEYNDDDGLPWIPPPFFPPDSLDDSIPEFPDSSEMIYPECTSAGWMSEETSGDTLMSFSSPYYIDGQDIYCSSDIETLELIIQRNGLSIEPLDIDAVWSNGHITELYLSNMGLTSLGFGFPLLDSLTVLDLGDNELTLDSAIVLTTYFIFEEFNGGEFVLVKRGAPQSLNELYIEGNNLWCTDIDIQQRANFYYTLIEMIPSIYGLSEQDECGD